MFRCTGTILDYKSGLEALQVFHLGTSDGMKRQRNVLKLRSEKVLVSESPTML